MPMIKWLKSTEANLTVCFFWVLEGWVRLYYRCQGQSFEKATKCIMQTSIWPSPKRCVKIKLPNISHCSIHQKALGQAFIQVFILRCHFQKVKQSFFFVSLDVFWFLSPLSDDESVNLAVIEGKLEFGFSALTWSFSLSLW